MDLQELKNVLEGLNELSFQLPNGQLVPAHFHVTEVGVVNKKYIDCGGTLRQETKVNLQLWEANDYDHRLHAEKFSAIIKLAEEQLGIDNAPVEIEYQGDTIEVYDLVFEQNQLKLVSKFTNCLAPDKCGVEDTKPKLNLKSIGDSTNTCTPGSGCC